ncbi:MAG: DUF3387 domain-containing protein, partial [Bacteroidales bacterium]|nr:DUF3387 domain-containing protein [Bacteroidales bacterium]
EKREAEVEKLTSKAAKADHIASRTIRAIHIKMKEDPVFYKKLSKLIKETIEDYHQHRIDEAEYLNNAKALEDQFLTGKRDNIPASIQGNDTAIALYNLIGEVFKPEIGDNMVIVTEMASGIDNVIKSFVFENDKIIVDWQNKSDIEGQIRIAIDDYIFDLTSKYDVKLSYDKIDELVEEG